MKFSRLSLICLLLTVCSISPLLSQQKIPLLKAIKAGKIKAAVMGNGGYRGKAVRLGLKNLTSSSIDLEIPGGQIFASRDSHVQDLMVTDSRMIALAAGRSQIVDLETMCIQSGNSSPRKGEKFTFGQMAKDHLLKLAQLIDKHDYHNSTAQSAVWSVANNDPVKHIYGEDTSMVKQLALLVSEATNTPIEEFRFTPQVHHISEISSSMEVFLEDYVDNLTLALYNEEGSLIRRYFSGRSYEPGFFSWKVGANHYEGDSSKVVLRLFEGDELVAEKWIQVGDSATETKDIHVQAMLNYDVPETMKGRVGLYDEEGRLCVLVQDDRMLKEGAHRTRLVAKSYVLPDHDYFMKIMVGEEEIASAPIRLDQEAPVLQPLIRKSGSFYINLEEEIFDAQLAVYDANGELHYVMYHITHLNPGRKKFSYRFSHDHGREATFSARLTGKEGEILWEKELN
ncbi:MAG: hypothetical protein AAFY71_00065 [Bacteroidota bacterium]